MGDIFSLIAEQAKGCGAEREFSLALHTTMGIGGNAPLCLRPQSVGAAVNAVRVLQKYGVPYIALGAGANVLASDKGFCGAVISTDKLSAVTAEEDIVYAESGVRMARLLRVLAEGGLGGFAFMAGIPASVGGAVYMNAGTARGHFGDGVLSVTAIDEKGVLREFSKEECAFEYKHTAFTGKGQLILSARLAAKYCCRARALEDIREVLAERERLPKGKSMGCVFKNPEGISAGALIERAGMKGAREGGAFISERHANFIINGGNATAGDVRALIERVKSAVLKSSGILLTEEIEYIGDD